ncbi:MAG TPA: energy transducer TonB [Bacillota bacterium]|nr:energy transducer TonB [Bacillota bacterium]
MSAAPVEPRSWPRRRLWAIVALVFALQVGLICWLGDRQPVRPRPAAFAPALQLLSEPATNLLALTDPTLFALPHRQGFSGLAWMQAPPQPFHPFTWTEEPRWLPLSVEQLGAAFNRFIETNQFNSLEACALPEPELTLPMASAPEGFPDRSTLRVEGGLADRPLTTPLQLRSWAHSDLLTNSVVQAVVDAAGRPISVTLLVKSGSEQADQHALEQVRTARFAPANVGGPQTTAPPLAQLDWGQLVFEWHTLALAPTNAPATGS